MITYLHAAGAWSSYLTERESATKETEQQTSILNIQVEVEDYMKKKTENGRQTRYKSEHWAFTLKVMATSNEKWQAVKK